jgi:protein-glutamine gamma-glutamyltransferase
MSSIGRAGNSPSLNRAETLEADKALDAAAADGKVTTSEIKAAERKLAAKYGEAKATQILLRALGQEAGKVDFKAVDWLQGRYGAMDGHVARYQDVLVEHLKGAKVLDANFDGKLDKNDLVFTKDASGKVNVEKIGQALCDKVRIGAAMVEAAYAMDAAKHDFDGTLKANPTFWKNPGGEMATMTLKPGKRASEAIRDIFANPDKYQFECATALVILRYKAMLELLGEKDFDRICKDLKVGPWDQEDHAAKTWKVEGKASDGSKVEATKDDIARLKPGDYTYFKNWSVSLAGYNAGWQGENVIFLGKGMYYGHPFGVISGQEIVDYLNEHRNPRAKREASLMDVRARIDPSILKEDKVKDD